MNECVRVPNVPTNIRFTDCAPTAVQMNKGREMTIEVEGKKKNAGRYFVVYARGDEGSVLMQSRKLGVRTVVSAEDFAANFKPRSL